MREHSAEWRATIINRLVFIAKCAPPAAVGMNPMEWTKTELVEWADAASELNSKIWPAADD